MASRALRSVTTLVAALALVMGVGPSAASVAPAAFGASSQAATVSTTTTTATTAPYKLLAQFGGSPARWNPCQAVPWVFNPAGAPVGGLTVVRAALYRVSQLTGLRFQYVGTTSTAPSSGYLHQAWGAYKPLLIGWSDPTHSDLLAGSGPSHVGETRVSWVGLSTPLGARAEYSTGVVVFNRTSRAALWGANSRYTYALHELGHAVGLAHADSPTNVMSTVIPSAVHDYGLGDRTGLVKVSSRYGCLPSIR